MTAKWAESVSARSASALRRRLHQMAETISRR